MQPIATDFSEGNYQYTQLARQGMWAIYRQQHRQAPVMRYEVIKIRVVPETVWPNGTTTPEREVYPGASTWGRAGWTCYSLAEAQALLAAWTTEEQET